MDMHASLNVPSRFYAGIDPGLSGGIAVCERTDGGFKWSLHKLPVVTVGKGRKELDLPAVAEILRNLTLSLATVEYPPKIPGNGVLGTASLFKGFGEIRGILATLRIASLEPSPQVWKRRILPGTAKDKDATVSHVLKAFPDIDLPKLGPRTTKYHDGIADAICLCWYGMLQMGVAL